jgi:hypothetical protein
VGQTLATWEARVQSLLANPPVTVLPVGDIDRHVYAAVRQFSLDRPRATYADFTGDGSSYQFAVPPGWVAGFSWVGAVEYPQGERPPVWLDLAEVQTYPSDDSPTYIQLNLTTPASGKKARVFYSIPYPLPDPNASTDLVPDTSFEYVAKLAAAGGARQLAARAAANVTPTFPSATIGNVEGEEKRWGDVADDYRKEYEAHVGTGGGPAPASAVIDWDASSDELATGFRWIFRLPRR